jgi:DNA-binding response OmpR family regulator
MSSASPVATATLIVYSDDPAVREQVRFAVGHRPAADIGRVHYVEAAVETEVVSLVEAGGIDLVILDGEAWPTGGLGISRQLRDEIADCPPIIVLLARRADRWLAAWSRCDAVLSHPLDPVDTAAVVADVLRRAGRGAPADATTTDR